MHETYDRKPILYLTSLYLRRSIVSRINCQTTKGAKKRPALCKSAWLQFISLAGLCQVYRASIEHRYSVGELADKVAMLPFFFILLTMDLRKIV